HVPASAAVWKTTPRLQPQSAAIARRTVMRTACKIARQVDCYLSDTGRAGTEGATASSHSPDGGSTHRDTLTRPKGACPMRLNRYLVALAVALAACGRSPILSNVEPSPNPNNPLS